jgi:hypothetical protein
LSSKSDPCNLDVQPSRRNVFRFLRVQR